MWLIFDERIQWSLIFYKAISTDLLFFASFCSIVRRSFDWRLWSIGPVRYLSTFTAWGGHYREKNDRTVNKFDLREGQPVPRKQYTARQLRQLGTEWFILAVSPGWWRQMICSLIPHSQRGRYVDGATWHCTQCAPFKNINYIITHLLLHDNTYTHPFDSEGNNLHTSEVVRISSKLKKTIQIWTQSV